MQRVQHGQDFNIFFDFNNKENAHPDCNRPVLGKIVANKNASKSKRLKSMQERIRDGSSKRQKSTVQNMSIKESQYITPGHSNRRNCSICKGSGHRRDNCPKIYCFGVPPLPFNDKHSRNELNSDLQSIDTYPCYEREHNDERSVSKSTPMRSIGIVIHNRYFVDSSKSRSSITNICLDCTFLSSQGADPIPMFEKSLFETAAIITWIVRSTSNVIVNLLKRNNIDSLLSQQRWGMSQEISQVASQLSQQNIEMLSNSFQSSFASGVGDIVNNSINTYTDNQSYLQSLLSFSQSQNNTQNNTTENKSNIFFP